MRAPRKPVYSTEVEIHLNEILATIGFWLFYQQSTGLAFSERPWLGGRPFWTPLEFHRGRKLVLFPELRDLARRGVLDMATMDRVRIPFINTMNKWTLLGMALKAGSMF